ncbi:unnamed protein product [Mycena citricolor]|uniref:Ndc10 domain-containing protein n=1 Tax=Mycena citricolor TaxID=2018698 RepID=A0AAD2JUW5_9AGAR|nr:unnamed protein product [Mycena citricolor]
MALPYIPPNQPHTSLSRKAARLSTVLSPPSFSVFSDIPVHNPSMIPFDSRDSTPTEDNTANSEQHRQAQALAELDLKTHELRLESKRAEQSDKGTTRSYQRHIDGYFGWWENNNMRRIQDNPNAVQINSLPITAAKASPFLEYEMTREKKKRGKSGSMETVAGSSVGKSHVSQVINALEQYRFNTAHLYKSCPEAQLGLRQDSRIRQFESASKHNEPKRAEKAQIIKAAGGMSDTYTSEEVIRCSRWALINFTTPSKICNAIRDRSMLLLGTCTAFRGDSTRQLQWSDLFLGSVLAGSEDNARVLGILSDNAKTNQTGRLDEFGVLRHRHVEMCGIGALALHFFAHFHILNNLPPVFAPQFEKGCGEYGKRDWYSYHVFFTVNPMNEMTYATHHGRVVAMHQANDISITKVTHGARPFAAQTARAHGATVSDTKAMGGWNDNGSFKNCYDRKFPVEALLGAANFKSSRPEAYHVARDTLCPPADLVAQIFPWIETEQKGLTERERADSRCRDLALRQVLATLLWFRTVLLQDMAVLFVKDPNAKIFSYPPFSSGSFRLFARDSTAAIQRANDEAALNFKNLPDHLVSAVKAVVERQSLAFESERKCNLEQMRMLQDQMTKMGQTILCMAGSKRAKLNNGSSHISATPSTPTLPETSFPMPAVFDSLPSDVSMQRDPFVWPGFQNEAGTSGMSDVQPWSELDTPSLQLSLAPLDLLPTFDLVATAPPPAVPNTAAVPIPLPSVFPSVPPSTSLFWPVTPMAPVPGTPEGKLAFYHQRYGKARFDKHAPQWIDGDWLPCYKYSKAVTVWDYWTEWKDGLDGYLPVEELTLQWGAKWRRNISALKTENTRRMRVVELVIKLIQRPHWDLKRTHRFISTQYGTYRARNFADNVVNNEAGRDCVLAAASNFA